MIRLKDLVMETVGPIDLAKLVYHKILIKNIFSEKDITKRDAACKQLVANLGGVNDALSTIKGALSSVSMLAPIVKQMLPDPKKNKETGQLEPVTLRKTTLYDIFDAMGFPMGSNKEKIYGQYQLVWSIKELCEKLGVKVL